MERRSWPQGSRAQVSSRPDSMRLGVQSPSVQSSRVEESRIQASSCSESKGPFIQSPSVQKPESMIPKCKSPESKRPDHTPRVQLFRYTFLNITIPTSMLFIPTGFVTMFCNNVETSLLC